MAVRSKTYLLPASKVPYHPMGISFKVSRVPKGFNADNAAVFVAVPIRSSSTALDDRVGTALSNDRDNVRKYHLLLLHAANGGPYTVTFRTWCATLYLYAYVRTARPRCGPSPPAAAAGPKTNGTLRGTHRSRLGWCGVDRYRRALHMCAAFVREPKIPDPQRFVPIPRL